ncbi:MAG: lysophospholipid acyltransferase family protein [Dehalococcoidia bacterium]
MSASRDTRREQAALDRWRPRPRWYHPLLGRLVITTSQVVMMRMNHLTIEGRERFDTAQDRGSRGLLTFSNHVSLFDDPLLISCLFSGPYSRVRWVGADAINFFGNRFKAWLFTAGRSVPIMRGAGLDQPGIDFLRDRLRAGDWVHLLPEGGRTRDPEARMAPSFKAGIGVLIAESKPLALPFYHYGMHKVLPVGAVRPRSGNRVRVLFGETMDCNEAWLSDLAERHECADGDKATLWRAITGEMYDAASVLEHQLHPAFMPASVSNA